VGAMMKDENIWEMKQRKKVKKEEKHARNMKNIGALQFVQ
jgi:CelD/BcsL family acetyltransferase involved in cellulose biosynthesis